MIRLSLRGIRSHKLRFATTTFAVVLGVAFVVGSLVVTDTLRVAIDRLFTGITSGIDVTVRAETGLTGGGNGGPSSRGRVPEDLVQLVREVDGVAAAEGTVGGYAQMLDEQGQPVETTGAPFLGVSVGEADELYPVTFDDGRRPMGPDEVAIDRDTSDEYDLDVGDRTEVLLVDGRRAVEIVGVFTFGETNSLLGARLTAFETSVAQDTFGAPGEFDTIDVAGDGVDADELRTRVQAALPDGYEATTQQTVIDEGRESVGPFLDIFQTALLVFAGIALFVSAFYINNTFSIVLGQRTRELALLRALGASAGQITASVLIEALTVGLAASVLGIAGGLGLAVVIQGVLSAGGFELPQESLALTGRTIAAAALVGLGVTTLSAIAPSRRAARVAPIAGMQHGTAPTGDGTRRRVGAVALLVGGTALGVAGLFLIEQALLVFTSLAVGALAVFLGVAMLSPLIAIPVAGLLARPFTWILATSGRLARANAMRNPHRTAKTASALMIGLALVTMVSVVGASLKESFADSVEGAVTSDYVVTTENFTGFGPDVVDALSAAPEIDIAGGVRFDRFLFEGAERDLTAVDADVAFDLIDVEVLTGSPDDLTTGTIFVHEDPADDLGLAVGDQVRVEFAEGGPQQVEVVGIYADSTYAGNYVVDLATFEAGYPANQLDLLAFAAVADDIDAADARPGVEAALEPFPQLVLEDRAEFNESQQTQVDQILVAVNALLALALFIALLGIANTLALSVIERTQEIGLLRAVGMTRGQSRLMVLVESVVVALFGAVLGLALGLVFGLGAATALPESAITVVTVPVASLVTIAVVAVLCGVAAGLLPARRAARLDVLDAITHR